MKIQKKSIDLPTPKVNYESKTSAANNTILRSMSKLQ